MSTATPPSSLVASRVVSSPIPPHLLPVIPTKQAALLTTDGHTTEVMAQSFHDRILVLITQVGKVGCLIQAQTPAPLYHSSTQHHFPPTEEADGAGPEPLPPPSSSTTLSHLFGTAPAGYDTLYDLYVSQVAAIVAQDQAKGYDASGQARPVVVGVGIRPLKREVGTDRNGPAGQDDDEWGNVVDERERERFVQVMQLVRQCRVW